jgi:hypothetical protein
MVNSELGMLNYELMAFGLVIPSVVRILRLEFDFCGTSFGITIELLFPARTERGRRILVHPVLCAAWHNWQLKC